MTSTITRQLLEELASNSLILLYSVEDSEYLQILKWEERARGASKYPAPPGATDDGASEGKIYFLQGENSKRVKIGFTRWDVESRAGRLQTGSSERLTVLGYFKGTLREERAIHRQFAHLNCGGEWFTNSTELTAFIARSVQSAGSSRPNPPPSSSPTPSSSSSSASAPNATAIAAGGDVVEPILPKNFPATEAEAVTQGEFAGCPAEFTRLTWHKAFSRGGRDAQDVPIRNFRSYLKIQQSYEQDRKAKEKNRSHGYAREKPDPNRSHFGGNL